MAVLTRSEGGRVVVSLELEGGEAWNGVTEVTLSRRDDVAEWWREVVEALKPFKDHGGHSMTLKIEFGVDGGRGACVGTE